MAPNRNIGKQMPRSQKDRTAARAPSHQPHPDAGRQQTMPSGIPSNSTFDFNAPPTTTASPINAMAGTPSWAQIEALFADMGDLGIPNTPDAAHQASEAPHTEQTWEELLSGVRADHQGINPDPCGALLPLAAPEPGWVPMEPFIDPALLALTPTANASTSENQDASDKQSAITLRAQLDEAEEKVDDLNDEVGILKIQLDKYEGPNTSDAVTAFQERITTMADEIRKMEMVVAALEDHIKRHEETIARLEGQVARPKSESKEIASLKEQIRRFRDEEKNSKKTLGLFQDRIRDQKTSLEQHKAKADELREKNDQQQRALAQHEAKADELREKNDQQQRALEERKANVDELHTTLEREHAAQQSKDERIKTQEDRIRQLSGEVMQHLATIASADDLREKNDQQRRALEERKSNVDELHSTLEREHAAQQSKDERIKTQEDRIRQLSGEVRQHLATIASADVEVTSLNKAAKERGEREANHREQRRVLKAKIENLEVELESTTDELKTARAEIKALQKSNREKDYEIQFAKESQGSYLKAYNQTLTLQDALKSQDVDMENLKGDLHDLEEEIGRLRKGRRGGSSRSESRADGETERVPVAGGYTTLEGVLSGEGENDDLPGVKPARPVGGTQAEEDKVPGGEPAGPAEGTQAEVEGASEGEEEEVGGETEVPRPVTVEPTERVVEVLTMVYCPWLWWKMPYQAFMLVLMVGGWPSVSAVFWKFVDYHLFAIDWPLVKSSGRRVEVAPHSPHPRRLPPPAKVMILLAWHLIVYACIGTLLWYISGTIAERTMWLRANDLSRATLVGLRESLRQSPNFGNPVVRFTLRLAPKVATFESVAGRWLPATRGVFG